MNFLFNVQYLLPHKFKYQQTTFVHPYWSMTFQQYQ
jgi:hypothetical protein